MRSRCTAQSNSSPDGGKVADEAGVVLVEPGRAGIGLVEGIGGLVEEHRQLGAGGEVLGVRCEEGGVVAGLALGAQVGDERGQRAAKS